LTQAIPHFPIFQGTEGLKANGDAKREMSDILWWGTDEIFEEEDEQLGIATEV
jgi:hypothetical protein